MCLITIISYSVIQEFEILVFLFIGTFILSFMVLLRVYWIPALYILPDVAAVKLGPKRDTKGINPFKNINC